MQAAPGYQGALCIHKQWIPDPCQRCKDYLCCNTQILLWNQGRNGLESGQEWSGAQVAHLQCGSSMVARWFLGILSMQISVPRACTTADSMSEGSCAVPTKPLNPLNVIGIISYSEKIASVG